MLLLRVAHDVLGDRCVALTAVSITMARSERESAVELGAHPRRAARGGRIARARAARLRRRTPPTAATTASPSCWRSPGRSPQRLGLQEILLGTNLDDLGDHRPGLDAAQRAGRPPPDGRGRARPRPRSARSPGSSACPPGTSPSWPACPRVFPTAPRSPPRSSSRSTPSRTACARSASASCASATTAMSRASSWRPGAMSRALDPDIRAPHRRAGPPRRASPSWPSTWPASPPAR